MGFLQTWFRNGQPVIHENQLARGIHSKRIRGLRVEPPVGDMGGETAHVTGVRGAQPPEHNFFIWIHKSPVCTKKLKYKIDHNSKTKNRNKKIHEWKKSVYEHTASFETNFILAKWLHLNNHISKSENWFFFHFSNAGIFHENLTVSKRQIPNHFPQFTICRPAYSKLWKVRNVGLFIGCKFQKVWLINLFQTNINIFEKKME